MAADLGISYEEALRRTGLGDAIGRLGAELERQEAATFAGLWIQHEPAYQVVVAFTRDGEKTIQGYVEDTPLAGVIEVRTAEATLAELQAAQAETNVVLEELGISVSSSINIQENRVELYVTDLSMFETALQEAGINLPDHVAVSTVYEPLGDDLPFEITPDPAIYFVQLKARSSSYMAALLIGTLIVKDGCLRIASPGDEAGSLIIWQTDYFVNNNQGLIEILDREGRVVARVGEELRMGGGEIMLTDSLAGQLREPFPAQCEGPYWMMGELLPDS